MNTPDWGKQIQQDCAKYASDLLMKGEAQQDLFADDTRKAFQEAYAGKMSTVEWVQDTFGMRMRHQPAREAFMDELEYIEPQNALWKMLAESKCPLVAELKKSIEDSYIKSWADRVAEFRSEE